MAFVYIATAVTCLAVFLWVVWKNRSTRVRDLEKKFAARNGITFFDSQASPCARRVRITLKEKGVKHYIVQVDLISKENRHPAYLAINPLGKVPAMVVRNVEGIANCCLFESNAITEWLDEQFPDTVQLYPSDPWERAQVKLWQRWEAGMAEDFWPMMYANTAGFLLRALYTRTSHQKSIMRQSSDTYYYTKQMKTFDGEFLSLQQMRHSALRLFGWLDILESALEGKKYLCGNRFTTADISVVPRVAMYPLIGLMGSHEERGRYPNVVRYLSEVASRPCFQPNGWTPVLVARGMLWPLVQWIGNWRTGKVFPSVRGKDIVRELDCFNKRKEQIPVPPASHDGVTLYSHVPWPDSIATRVACFELGIAAEIKEVDMMRLEHRAASYLALNPCGEVPTLFHGGRIIYDPKNIMEYLDAVFSPDSSHSFLPSDPTERGRVRMWQGWSSTCFNYQLVHLYRQYIISSIVKSAFSSKEELLKVLNKSTSASEHVEEIVIMYESDVADEEQARMSPYKSSLVTALQYLNCKLAGQKFLVGSKLTAADITVFSVLLLFKWVRIPIPEGEYANVHAWMKSLLSHAAFSTAQSEVDDYMLSHGISEIH